MNNVNLSCFDIFNRVELMKSIRNVFLNKPENNPDGYRNVCVTKYKYIYTGVLYCINCYAYESPCSNCIDDPNVLGFMKVSFADIKEQEHESGYVTYDMFLTYDEFYKSSQYVKEYNYTYHF